MQINSFNSKISVDTLLEKHFSDVINSVKPSRVFILVDENTERYCLPHLYKLINKEKVYVKKIKQGEEHKNINTVNEIWKFLQEKDCERGALMIHLGGGVLLDIGGFAASTFKRGIRFVNVPTTLLSMVDASVGGKVGFNFNNFKNHIGLFSQPQYVLVDPVFLKTLPDRHIYSGWAEMIKHGMIHSNDHLENLLQYDPLKIGEPLLKELIGNSIHIKNHFVQEDPYEENIRKALNFGHTIGHALESYMFEHGSLLHGEAVALGMICELYLSRELLGFPEEMEKKICNYLLQHYPKIELPEKDFSWVINFMKQDKKNQNEKINFTLLKNIANPVINQEVDEGVVIKCLHFYNALVKMI